jgi:hypothetical protein
MRANSAIDGDTSRSPVRAPMVRVIADVMPQTAASLDMLFMV